MPIAYRIDHERGLILAEGHGVVAAKEIFDMTDVPRIIEPSEEAIRALAKRSTKRVEVFRDRAAAIAWLESKPLR